MEILERSIPTLQNAIASGLESVKAGIAESAKASGVAALGIAQDSFSFEQIGTTSSADLPAVSGTAEYPAPGQYFRRFPGTASDSPISSLAISKTLSDPNFNVPKALQNFGNTSGSMVENAMKYLNAKVWQPNQTPGDPGSGDSSDHLGMEDHMGDMYWSEYSKEAIGPSLVADVTYDAVNRFGRDKSDAATVNSGGGSMQKEMEEKMKDFQNPHAYRAEKRFGQDKSDATSVEIGSGYPATDRFGRDKVEGTAAESVAGAGNAQQLLKIGPLGKAVGMYDVSYSAEDRFGRDKVEGQSGNREEGIKASEARMWKPTPSATGTRQEEMKPGEAQMWKPTPSAGERYGQDKSDVASLNDVRYGVDDRWKSASGLSDAASNRSIIVVGGKTDTAASDRSIIVVGGKTSSTYFQTIDDSLKQLQKNPTPETSNLFTQQFSVVRDMVSTVTQTVNFQQTVASNRFTSLR
ncbi:hypothetical protein L0152_02295 [bacterium]|nr:hypothetical protein [bacterium]